jgi:hypothetical protein
LEQFIFISDSVVGVGRLFVGWLFVEVVRGLRWRGLWL